LTEQLLDVKGWARTMIRSWRILTLFVLIGLLASAGYVVSSLPRYKATALVLLPPSSSVIADTSSSTARHVTADAEIATSAAILLPAAKRVAPSMSLSQLQTRVKASAVASGVLEISATASTRTQAEGLANAVASRLVSFLTANGSAANSSVIAGLEAEEAQLTHQLGGVEKEAAATTQRIGSESSTSPSGDQDRALLAQLTSQEASINLQISSVKSQIASAQLGQISANLGTEVIQRATSASPPSVSSLALPLVGGLFGGGLVGSVLLMAVNRARPRVWTRDGLAMALGAPVVLSLDVTQRRSLGDWTQLLERHEPGPLESWNVVKALRELGTGTGEHRDLMVLAFDGDLPAVTEAVQIAVTAAASGFVTELCVLAPDRAADTLRAVCSKYDHEHRYPRPGLTVHDRPSGPRAQASDLSVTVVVADIDNPAGSVVALRADGISVVAISAGFASPDALARVGMAATGSGSPIRAICVANPEARDDTVGRFPDGGSTKSLVEHRRHLRHSPAGAMERSP
jgi:capsular polysaccharide biosynthesis protein